MLLSKIPRIRDSKSIDVDFFVILFPAQKSMKDCLHVHSIFTPLDGNIYHLTDDDLFCMKIEMKMTSSVYQRNVEKSMYL